MASARELLEQADELMRRNRGRSDVDIPVLTEVVREASRQAEPVIDVPVLTDVVEAGPAAPAARVELAAAAQAESEAQAPPEIRPPGESPMPPKTADAVELMRSVESIPVDLPMDGDTSDWLVMDTIDPSTHSITGVAPDTLAVVPPVTLKTPGTPTPPALASPPPPSPPMDDEATIAAAAAGAAARAAAESERWRALAEQLSMQVLQRVDLFTDAGLKTQLAEHLQPIVERASVDLVSAITEHVGGLLRTYVAEAIEREIAQWRRDH